MLNTKMPKSEFVLFLSDIHSGSSLGLVPPGTLFEGENGLGQWNQISYPLNEGQTWLWKVFKDAIKKTKKIIGDSELVVVVNGDLTQGGKYKQELIATEPFEQIFIAYSCVDFLLKELEPNARVVRFGKGTNSHVYDNGSAEVIVGKLLANKHPQLDVKTVHHGLGTLRSGKKIDFAHHGPFPGSRAWLKGNSARFYLRDLMIREMRSGGSPADLYVRSHYHQLIHEVMIEVLGDGTEVESHLIITPSMALMNSFAMQATQSNHSITNGMVLAEFKTDGALKIHNLVDSLDLRYKEKWL